MFDTCGDKSLYCLLVFRSDIMLTSPCDVYPFVYTPLLYSKTKNEAVLTCTHNLMLFDKFVILHKFVEERAYVKWFAIFDSK